MARTKTSRGGTDQEVVLKTKLAPSQDRSRVTFEMILKVAGDLLGEVGIERLSTNMICERAGLTPPALYRYFPNKYAILREMGERLMKAEDRVVFRGIAGGQLALDGTLEHVVDERAGLLTKVRRAARRVPGGEWILRVMRAVPVLQEVRITSMQTVSEELQAHLRAAYPAVDEARLRAATLLSTALGTAANDLISDMPELEGQITQEYARMIALYYRNLVGVAVEQVVGAPPKT